MIQMSGGPLPISGATNPARPPSSSHPAFKSQAVRCVLIVHTLAVKTGVAITQVLPCDRSSPDDKTFKQPIIWVTTLVMVAFHIGAFAALFVFSWKPFLIAMLLCWSPPASASAWESSAAYPSRL
jgi:hypothetical protein